MPKLYYRASEYALVDLSDHLGRQVLHNDFGRKNQEVRTPRVSLFCLEIVDLKCMFISYSY